MSEQEERKTEFYFDTFSGALLVGQVAVDSYIESGGNPADIYPLKDLLLDNALSDENVPGVRRLRFKSGLQGDWDNDTIDHCYWLYGVARKLNKDIIDAAAFLGLGYSVQQITDHSQHFNSLSDIYGGLKLEGLQRRGVYNKWSIRQCLEYVRNVAHDHEDHVAEVPWKKHFNQIAYKGKGPSSDTLRAVTGLNITDLLEHLDYVDASRWKGNQQRYIEWGVKFMIANYGNVPSVTAIQQLFQQRRAPGISAFYEHFASMPDFHKHVRQEFDGEMESRARKFNQVMQGLADGSLSPLLFQDTSSEGELLYVAAKFQLVDAIVLNTRDFQKRDIAKISDPLEFKLTVIEKEPSCTINEIDDIARELGIYYDLFPPKRLLVFIVAA